MTGQQVIFMRSQSVITYLCANGLEKKTHIIQGENTHSWEIEVSLLTDRKYTVLSIY